jgi:hypothetical protein
MDIEKLVGRPFGPPNSSTNNNNDSTRESIKKSNGDCSKQGHKQSHKNEYFAYKYSNRGKNHLHEAVIIDGKPLFLKYADDKICEIASIEEEASERIIKPPSQEEHPYEPYEFKNLEEVHLYEEMAKKESIGSIFRKAYSIVSKYNDQDKHKLTLIAGDIVWSYFQDKFSTTHYLGVNGDNGSGKSTVGDTFESTGYRPVNMTDPNAANLFRILGTLEAGQCTIIADEAEKVDQSSDIMAILKTGYHIKKKVAKTNTNTWKQEFYWTYCFKIIIGEKSLSQSNAKGVLDRLFRINTYSGKPKHDIKEVLNPQGNPERQRLLNELMDFRKLMLIYRLIHFADSIPDIDIGVDGRDKELCKPIIQLFYNTEAQVEIENALQKFIDEKNQRKESSIEAALYPTIANLISENGNEISAGILWESIKKYIEGHWDERKPNEYQTSEYGTIYRNTITNIICDKFGAKRKHREKGNYLIFNPEKVTKAGKVYNTKISIQTKLIIYKPECTEGSEGSVELTVKSQKNNVNKNTENSTKSDENIQDIPQNITSVLQEKDDRKLGSFLEPSFLSEPSDKSIAQDPGEQERRETTIHRKGHTDIWACGNCILTGDRHFMQVHICSAGKTRR